MITRLFVYGTLAPGKPNEHLLKAIGGTWEPATVRGTLYPNGWGAALGYPTLILDDSADEVEGLLFTSDALDNNWETLDAFEGPGYKRVETTVSRDDGTIADAYVYVLNG